MSRCVQTADGYKIAGTVLPEVVALVDVKRGLALWSGARETIELHLDSLRNRCKSAGIIAEFDSDIRLLALPGDVSIDEMNWMIKKCLLPRRVAMRLRDGKG